MVREPTDEISLMFWLFCDVFACFHNRMKASLYIVMILHMYWINFFYLLSFIVNISIVLVKKKERNRWKPICNSMRLTSNGESSKKPVYRIRHQCVADRCAVQTDSHLPSKWLLVRNCKSTSLLDCVPVCILRLSFVTNINLLTNSSENSWKIQLKRNICKIFRIF